MKSSLENVYNWIKARNNTTLLIFVIIGYSFFFTVILLVFIPTGAEMDATGYSITDFQQAWTKERMDEILLGWNSILDVVKYQLWADYLFIIGGFVGNFSIFVIFAKNLKKSPYMIPNIGMFSVFVSRFSDAIENVMGLLIVYDPTGYFEPLVFLQSLFATIKFSLTPVVYGSMILCFFLLLYQKMIDKSGNTQRLQ